MTMIILTPNTAAEAGDMVRQAAARKERLFLTGNGSKAPVSRPADGAASLSSAAMSGIIAYTPQELVVTAHAGTPLAEIEAALAKNNQQLPFEPGNWSELIGTGLPATIGGVAATNLSGPRRYVAGAARDNLLGLHFVNGLGEEIKSGGQVMKNVTGLDLVKLLAGSWGGLGLITQVSFKALPKPETQATLVITGLDDGEAARAMAEAMATSCEVSGAAHLPDAASLGFETSTTLLRLEGLSESVADRMVRLKTALKAHEGHLSELDADRSAHAWTHLADVGPFAADGADAGKPVWKLSVPPMSGCKTVADIRQSAGCDAFYDWQGGLVWLRMETEDAAHAGLIRAAIARNGGGHATLMRASDTLRAAVPVFEPVGPAIAMLNERIRDAVDPHRIFTTRHAEAMPVSSQAS